MRFYIQNLNEKKGGRTGCILREGRCWLRFTNHFCLRLSWHIPTTFFRAGIGVCDGDDALELSFGCGLFALWFGIQSWPLDKLLRKLIRHSYEGREIEVSVHDGDLWWSFWNDPMSWSSKTPQWRHGHFSPVDFIFGRTKYESRSIDTTRVVVPMPEGGYSAFVKINEDTWRRPRWPFVWRRMIRSEIKPDNPIPFPGKGENSWDCGDDATHSLYGPHDTAFKAAMALCESVMRDRVKYGGWDWKPAKETSDGHNN